MTEFSLLEQRIIQRNGLILIPSTWSGSTPLFLVADLVVLPTITFNNFNYQPSRRRYSNINMMAQGRVIREVIQNYAQQEWQFYDYGFFELVTALNCSEQVIINNQSLIGASQTPPVPTQTVTSTIGGGGVYPRYRGDSFLINTLDDSRILYSLYQAPNFACTSGSIPKFTPSVLPLPQPLLPDDISVDDVYPVSAPYNPPDDDGFTYVPPPPVDPTPDDCTSTTVVVNYTSNGTPAQTQQSGLAPARVVTNASNSFLGIHFSTCSGGNVTGLYSDTRFLSSGGVIVVTSVSPNSVPIVTL